MQNMSSGRLNALPERRMNMATTDFDSIDNHADPTERVVSFRYI